MDERKGEKKVGIIKIKKSKKMKKFKVYWEVRKYAEVEAKNKEEAEEIVADLKKEKAVA